MKEFRIAILSDFTPQETLGGGTLLAKELSREMGKLGDFQYLFITGADFKIKNRANRPRIFQYYADLVSIVPTLKILFYLRKQKINVIWLHQIGHRIPYSLIPLARLFRYGVILTLHDLNIVWTRKVYPDMLKRSPRTSTLKLIYSKNKIYNYFWNFRFKVVKLYVNRANSIVGIGEICRSILFELGVKAKTAIPNGVALCDHGDLFRREKSMLFAGRLSGKGLSQVIEAFKFDSSEEWHLYLAGDVILNEIATRELKPSQFTYLGLLSRNQLTEFIHSVEYVAVLSAYYDNYPTIALEAIMHGAKPITTPITGVARLVESISPDLVIPMNTKLVLKNLESVAPEQGTDFDTLKTQLSLDIYLAKWKEKISSII